MENNKTKDLQAKKLQMLLQAHNQVMEKADNQVMKKKSPETDD